MSFTQWYINWLVKQPFIVLVGVIILSCSCMILSFFGANAYLPNFQDPQMGFSTRNTKISSRILTYKNLQDELRPLGSLTKNPKEYMIRQQQIKNQSTNPTASAIVQKHKKKPKKKSKNKTENAANIEEPTVYGKVITIKNTTDSPDNRWQILHNILKVGNNPFINYPESDFCGYPDVKYAHLILTASDHGDLLTIKHVLSMCRLQRILTSFSSIPDVCLTVMDSDGKCCKPWSLPNYLTEIAGKATCLDLTENDVEKSKRALFDCYQDFQIEKLTPNCSARPNCNIHLPCIKHDAAYSIFNFIVPSSFEPSNVTGGEGLKETVMFLPFATGMAALPFYREIEKLMLDNQQLQGLSIVAMDFGLKDILFDELLINDLRLMGLAAAFVMLCLWIYTTSIFLTFVTIISLVFAMAIGYCLYINVLGIKIFPFMNLLTVIILIGIGTDNTFIICKVWKMNEAEPDDVKDLRKAMLTTFEHAFASIFVTTLITVTAFFGSCVSSVMAIVCFSIFAGTVVSINFLLTITWIPAALIIWERYHLSNTCCVAVLERMIVDLESRWMTLSLINNFVCNLWKKKKTFLITAVIKWKYFWIASLGTTAVASAVIVLGYPGLKLPTSEDFQLLQADHLFEKYDFMYKDHFRYSKRDYADIKLPLRFVWGVLPKDSGDHLNPTDPGVLSYDSTFDMSNPASQIWLSDFCANLKKQPFVELEADLSFTRCFIESFVKSMEVRCVDSFVHKNKTPCCNVSSFPFTPEVFDDCLVEDAYDTYRSPANFLYPKTAGALFAKNEEGPSELKAVVIEFESTVSFSLSYEAMDKFFNEVEEWTRAELASAPEGLRNGFFVSDLSFYDLQLELSSSTKTAVFVSMGLALIVLVLSTLNPVLSVLAIITITGCIITTIAIFILLDWKLNILESISVSTAVGLAVDFSLHYSINYSLCPKEVKGNREEVTKYALSCLMGPSFMTGLTTAASGFFMLFSSILPYYQIGVFLILVMVVSWVYATFFLGSLLATLGPRFENFQFSYAELGRRLANLRAKRNELVITNQENSTSNAHSDSISFIRREGEEPQVRYTVKSELISHSSIATGSTVDTEEK